MYAPILLFVYNRPEHTRRVIESLQANAEAAESELFIYADQARHETDAPKKGRIAQGLYGRTERIPRTALLFLEASCSKLTRSAGLLALS